MEEAAFWAAAGCGIGVTLFLAAVAAAWAWEIFADGPRGDAPAVPSARPETALTANQGTTEGTTEGTTKGTTGAGGGMTPAGMGDGRRPEAGSRKAEAGDRKAEAGGRKGSGLTRRPAWQAGVRPSMTGGRRRAFTLPGLPPGAWVQVTVQRPRGEMPGYIQCDVILKGRSVVSGRAEALRRVGIAVPEVPEDLPQGRYRVTPGGGLAALAARKEAVGKSCPFDKLRALSLSKGNAEKT